MPIDFRIVDLMLESGIGLTLIVIVAYRLLAASKLSFLAHKGLYCFFCAVLVVAFVALSPMGGGKFGEDIAFALLVFSPCLFVGFIGLLRKWNLKRISVSATLELVLFPLWFSFLCTVIFCLGGGE